MHSKKCTNCGADNDPILTNCLFCKSPLPVIDLTSLSNETLVMNAAQWIGKLKEGAYVIYAKDYNAWTGKGFSRIEKGIIQGNALQYLSLLEIRATTNVNLINTVNRLRVDYEKHVKAMPTLQKRVLIVVSIWILIWVLFVLAIKLIN